MGAFQSIRGRGVSQLAHQYTPAGYATLCVSGHLRDPALAAHARLHRKQAAAARAPAAHRGAGARHRADGRGRPLLHRRPDADLGRPGRVSRRSRSGSSTGTPASVSLPADGRAAPTRTDELMAAVGRLVQARVSVAALLGAYAATAERWHDLRADARAANPVFDENARLAAALRASDEERRGDRDAARTSGQRRPRPGGRAEPRLRARARARRGGARGAASAAAACTRSRPSTRSPSSGPARSSCDGVSAAAPAPAGS